MIECTMPYIPICIGIAAILFIIAIFKESFKNAVIAVFVLLSIPVYLILDSDTIEQCKIQQNKQRIENDKQYLLDNLEQIILNKGNAVTFVLRKQIVFILHAMSIIQCVK